MLALQRTARRSRLGAALPLALGLLGSIATVRDAPATRAEVEPLAPAQGEAAPAAQAPEHIETALERARAALESGDLDAAERLFREILTATPRAVDAHLGLAQLFVARGDGVRAAAAAATAAELLLDAGNGVGALQILDTAARADPRSATVQRLRGRALLGAEQYAAAITALETALALGAVDLDLRLLLAAAYWETGELERSEAAYREAVSASGEAVVALHQLGRLYLWQGDYARARDVLTGAAERASDVPDLLLDLARALEGTGETERAASAYDRAVTAAPNSAQARYGYGRLLARLGRREAARVQMDVYRGLYEAEQRQLHESKLQYARVDRGWELLEQGRPADAAEEFRRAPESVDALEGLAAALTAVGDHAGAVKALERALALAPDRRDLQLALARARVAAGQGS